MEPSLVMAPMAIPVLMEDLVALDYQDTGQDSRPKLPRYKEKDMKKSQEQIKLFKFKPLILVNSYL